MIISTEQLSKQLKQKLSPVYLLTGDEPLLKQEAAQSIRQAARQQAYNERELFVWQANSFDWTAVYESAENLSLFDHKKIIELRLDKMHKEAKNFLQDYKNNTDTLLLLSCSKLDAATKKSAWFSQFEKSAVVVEIYPMKASQFSIWLKNRFRQANLKVDNDTIQYIIASTEGNLLAAKQEIEKLQLLFSSGELTLHDVRSAVSDQARFDVFHLADSVLDGKLNRALHILNHLYNEGTEPTLILWALTREIRLLLSFIEEGDAPVWHSRKTIYKKRSQIFTTKELYQLLQQAHRLDMIIKGINKQGDIQDEFTTLCNSLCKQGKSS
ncbi:MAG: DNA polymerase III subunit delta [Pseudomonadota bacterium]